MLEKLVQNSPVTAQSPAYGSSPQNLAMLEEELGHD
jgi:hypothetical protein